MLVVLNLLLKYDPDKTASYASLDSPEDTLKRLRHHLTALRMVHPKPQNVRFIAEEGIHFFWITEENSVTAISAINSASLADLLEV